MLIFAFNHRVAALFFFHLVAKSSALAPLKNDYYMHYYNVDWMDEVLAKSAVKHQTKFVAMTSLAKKKGTIQSVYVLPMILKLVLLAWEGKYSANVWDLPSSRPTKVNAAFIDFCPNNQTSCKRYEGYSKLSRAMHGNWTKGQTWTPFRFAMSGDGASPAGEEFALNSNKIAMTFIAEVFGWDNSHPFSRDLVSEFITFTRVDDNEFALTLVICDAAKFLKAPNLMAFGCDSVYESDQLYQGFNIQATGIALAPSVVLMIELSGADQYEPDNNDKHLKSWISAFVDTWSKRTHFFVASFSKDSPTTCPMWDFLSMSFIWLLGQGAMWMGLPLDGEKYDAYHSQTVLLNSPYKHATVLDGHYSWKKQLYGKLWPKFETWYNNTMYQQSSQMESWLQSSMTADAASSNRDTAIYMMDCAWSILLISNKCYLNFGHNATILQINTAARDNTFSFEGVTGRVGIQAKDRKREWTISVRKRPPSECTKTRVPCDMLQLADTVAIAGKKFTKFMKTAKECLRKNPVVVSTAPEAQLGTAWSNAFENQPYEKTFNFSYWFGCETKVTQGTDDTCPPGKYYDLGMNACIECERGRFSRAGTANTARFCNMCPVGRYSASTGASECTLCGAGKFSGVRQSEACTECKAGKFTDADGKAECSACMKGKYAADDGASSCDNCRNGEYQDKLEATNCIKCPASKTTRFLASDTKSSCLCGVGDFCKDGLDSCQLDTQTCVSCSSVYPPKTVDCKGWGELPRIRAGFMTLPGKTVLYSCSKFLEACPGGKSIKEWGCTGVAQGVACAWCGLDKMWNQKNGLCTDCTDGAKPLAIGAAFIVVLFLCIKLRPLQKEFTELTVVKNVSLCFITVPMAHTADFMQLNSIYSRSGIKWPTSSSSVFSGVGSLFDMGAFQVPCLTNKGEQEGDAANQVLLMNVVPAILILVIFLLVIPSVLFSGARERRLPHPIGACNTVFTILVTFFITILNFSVTLVFAQYPHERTGGASSLSAFPYILLDSSQYQTMLVIAAIALVLWCGGTLTMITIILYIRPCKKDAVFFQRCTLALVVKYNTERSWWILVEMMTKFFSCISVVMSTMAAKQMQVLVGVFLIYGTMLANAFPYRFARHMYSDTIYTISKIMVLCMAVNCISGDGGDGMAILVVVGIAYLNCFFVVMHSLYCFLKGKAADPQWDRDTAYMFLGVVQKIFMIPKQHAITELVPGMDSSSARWSTAAAVNTQIVALETATESLKECLKAKIASSSEDSKFVSTNFVPAEKRELFSQFIANQEEITVGLQNKTIGDPKKKMADQEVLIKNLLAQSKESNE